MSLPIAAAWPAATSATQHPPKPAPVRRARNTPGRALQCGDELIDYRQRHRIVLAQCGDELIDYRQRHGIVLAQTGVRSRPQYPELRGSGIDRGQHASVSVTTWRARSFSGEGNRSPADGALASRRVGTPSI